MNQYKLVIDQGCARFKICLTQGYKIYFTRNYIFRDILGFDAVVMDQPLIESSKICDVLISINIYINLEFAKCHIFQGKSTVILYSFF